jgi:hypothetical protein
MTKARRVVLEELGVSLGKAWAERCREDLRLEGRAVAGGWPGTLPEARARIARQIAQELARRGMPAATETEREICARAAYASARADWQSHREKVEDL